MIALPSVVVGWRCIVADPPWSFRDKGSRIAPDQRRAAGVRHYETMRLGDICRLPVHQVAADDALLFLWTTSAHLLDGSAAKVCEAWDFEPKTTIAWVKVGIPRVDLREELRTLRHLLIFHDDERVADATKDLRRRIDHALAKSRGDRTIGRIQIGMGHYTRAAHEHLVIARRGKARVLRRDVPSVFFAPRGRHSAKPDESYRIVESLAEGPRLELFSRQERDGWTAWGDQIEGRRAA